MLPQGLLLHMRSQARRQYPRVVRFTAASRGPHGYQHTRFAAITVHSLVLTLAFPRVAPAAPAPVPEPDRRVDDPLPALASALPGRRPAELDRRSREPVFPECALLMAARHARRDGVWAARI